MSSSRFPHSPLPLIFSETIQGSNGQHTQVCLLLFKSPTLLAKHTSLVWRWPGPVSPGECSWFCMWEEPSSGGPPSALCREAGRQAGDCLAPLWGVRMPSRYFLRPCACFLAMLYTFLLCVWGREQCLRKDIKTEAFKSVFLCTKASSVPISCCIFYPI